MKMCVLWLVNTIRKGKEVENPTLEIFTCWHMVT